MRDVAQVVDQLTEGLEPSVSAVCREVMRALSVIPPQQLRRIPVMWLADTAHLRWDDALMQSALAALTSIRAHPLVMYFIMYDDIQHRELTFEADEVSESLVEGELIHPQTGYPIPDFVKRLKPVYRLNPVFVEILGAHA